MRLSHELIYEATLDDDLFERLPVVMAEHLNARSCTLHWRDADDGHEVFAHSHYFSDAQMAMYTADFADHDLWTLAALEHPNRSWICAELVDENEYLNSRIYNEWTRAIGDDTLHCVGAVTSTAAGFGIIGVHRGRTQMSFEPTDATLLEEYVPHLRRMFGVRMRLRKSATRYHRLERTFDCLPDAVIVVDREGRAVQVNAVADAMLREGAPVRLRFGKLVTNATCEPSLEFLIAEATATREPRGGDALLLDVNGIATRLSIIPLVGPDKSGCALLLFKRHSALSSAIVTEALRRRYGLSFAESSIAVRIADGASLDAISQERSVTIGTLRTQVASILSRMNVNRQSQVAGIIARLRS